MILTLEITKSTTEVYEQAEAEVVPSSSQGKVMLS